MAMSSKVKSMLRGLVASEQDIRMVMMKQVYRSLRLF